MGVFDPRTEIHYIIDRVFSIKDDKKYFLDENILSEYAKMGVGGINARDCFRLEIAAIEEMWKFYRSVHKMNKREFSDMIYSNREYIEFLRKAIIDRVKWES